MKDAFCQVGRGCRELGRNGSSVRSGCWKVGLLWDRERGDQGTKGVFREQREVGEEGIICLYRREEGFSTTIMHC